MAVEPQTIEMVTGRLAAEKPAREAAESGLKTVAALDRLGKATEDPSRELREHQPEVRIHSNKLATRGR